MMVMMIKKRHVQLLTMMDVVVVVVFLQKWFHSRSHSHSLPLAPPLHLPDPQWKKAMLLQQTLLP